MKRVISLFLSVIMLLSVTTGLDLSAYAADEVKTHECINELEKLVDINQFSQTLRTGFMNCQTTIDISSYKISASSKNRSLVLTYVRRYMPEIFNYSSLCYNYSNGILIRLNIKYKSLYDNPSEFMAAYSKMEAEADKIIQDLKDNDNISASDKALLVHDRLAVHTEYYDEDDTSGTAYGALVNHKSVCSGYSQAYYYLMNKLGFKVFIIDSALLNHSWNIIYIEGVPYYVDVTWDDPSNTFVGYVEHENLLRSADGIAETGHDRNGIDYDTVIDNVKINNTKYDDCYWQKSTTEFQLINDNLYYIDNYNETLNAVGKENKCLCSVHDIWWLNENTHYVGNFSKLSSFKDSLIYTTSRIVYKYDLKEKKSDIIFIPETSEIGEYYLIYGFKCEDGLFYCYMSNTSLCSYPEREKYLIKYDYDVCNHIECYEKIITPTCTEDGYTTHTCKKCGYSYNSNYTFPKGHMWNSGETISETTCTEDGTIIYTCMDCGTTKIEYYDKFGHLVIDDEFVAPTCTTDGLTEGRHCLICGEVFVAQEKLDAFGHNYRSSITKPTCTEEGYTTHTCLHCGNSYTDNYLQAIGHNFGNNNKTCSVCGDINPNYVQPTQPTAPAQPSSSASLDTAKVSKPKSAKISKLTKAEKSFKASWKKVSGVTGYQIQYSTSKKFTKKASKSVTVKGSKKASTTIKKLKSKKKYYVRIRTYKNVKLNDKTVKVYSSWSKAKTVTTK